MVEFGRIVTVTSLSRDTEALVRDNYERTKAKRFPTWDGEPLFQIDEVCPCCGRFRASGWFADVPAEFVEA